MGGGQGATDAPVVDTAEQVYISSLALLKMLKHGRAGVPMEVMGLMLGEFVDDYTVRYQINLRLLANISVTFCLTVSPVSPCVSQQNVRCLNMLYLIVSPPCFVCWIEVANLSNV